MPNVSRLSIISEIYPKFGRNLADLPYFRFALFRLVKAPTLKLAEKVSSAEVFVVVETQTSKMKMQ
ncbi:hypothetical protein RhiirA1_486430, partial [Rhizophagus irregularis]